MVTTYFIYKLIFRELILLWAFMSILSIAFSQVDNTNDLLTAFREEILSSKQSLDELALEIDAFKQWFKNYQSQLLSESAEDEELNDVISKQLNEIWQEIERLELKTPTSWLDILLNQLDTNAFADAPPDEIEGWINSQRQYININQIQADVLSLENKIGQIQKADTLTEENAQTTETLEILEIPYPTEKDDVLEATLLYLLAGLEFWGAWLEPTNEIGLLPEAEGRFMVSSTPILQTGVVTGGIGVVGFAQPITISRSGIPEGFSKNNFLYETALAGYDDYVEDVFEQASYLDRLNYQYGVEVTGRVARVYSKNIEIELTLASMLRKMGAPPEVAEIWVAEYAEIASFPQTIQLSWLIAGNPLAKDYQGYVRDMLETFDLNTLLTDDISDRGFSSPQTPNSQWINQDPFWEEVQKQPFLNAFTNFLSDTSEEIKRSFIVSLFFLEPTPLGIGAISRTNKDQTNSGNVNLRSKPFFWSDTDTTPNTNSSILPIAGAIVDPDHSLVTEAIKQKKNLIKYWVPGQDYQIIPWSERNLLNPNDKGTAYFIMAVTALSQFAPEEHPRDKSNYATIVSSIINNHLPKNQPVLKVLVGQTAKDRRIVNNEGLPVYFAASDFLWIAEQLDNDAIMEYATNRHKTINSPYVVVSIENGPYIAGGLSQIKNLFGNRQDYTVETVVLKAKGVTHYRGKLARNSLTTLREDQSTWLNNAGKVAQDIFNWPFSKQDRLTIQSTHRFAEFERSHAEPEIKISSMVTWNSLPSNKELSNERSKWQTDVFLMRVRQGYFLLHTNELEYLQKHADEESQVHTLLLSHLAQRFVRISVQTILQNRNLGCESIRVLSTGGAELAYSPQCSLVVTESGWELAQASHETQLVAALDGDQPITIFRSEDKPASALPLSFLVDAKQSSFENLQVSTLVPVYNLEDLDAEEKEITISLNIADAISRTLQFFPQQKEFEVLMPTGEFILDKQVKYTSIPPKTPVVKYDYDKINVVVPTENQSVTFYSLRESAVEVLPNSSEVLKLSQSDVMTSSGDWNKNRIMELAQNFHQAHSLPYVVVQANQGEFYGGSLLKLKEIFPKTGEPPKQLAVMVTKLAGTDFWGSTYQGRENLGWLNTASLKVLEQSRSLKIDPSTTITVWSSSGKRQAIFTAGGILQIEQTVQWQSRPDNQTLKSLRKTWRGNMILVYLPSQGYLLTQPNEAKFLSNLTPIQIDSLIVSFDRPRNFSDIVLEANVAIKELHATSSIRVLSPSATPDLEGVTFYDGVDIGFYLDNQKQLQVDWKHSGLELAKQDPKQWLNYAEAKNSPLAIFQWPDDERSLALFIHILKGTAQDIAETNPQFIVPAYGLEDLDEPVLDNKEIEESIFITLKETLRQASAIWPNQTSFQIVMPHEKGPRLYSQDAPAQIQSNSLGVIEITRQSDNTKTKYYYRPN